MNVSLLLPNFRNIVLTLLVGLMSVFVHSSFAAVNSYTGLNHIQNIINNTPGVQLANMGSGLATTASSGVTVTTASGMRIPVPVSATATVSKSALALNAAKVIRAGSVIGAAVTAYEVYDWVKKSGVTTCAPPNFFCTPAAGPTSVSYGWQYGGFPVGGADLAVTADYACKNGFSGSSSYGGASRNPRTAGNSEFIDVSCALGSTNPAGWMVINRSTSYQCPSGTSKDSSGMCVASGTTSTPYTSDQALAEAIMATEGWPTSDSVKLYQALRNDMAKNGAAITPAEVVPASTPVQVTAPPVQMPEIVVKIEQKVQPDGSTVNIETAEQTTIIPNIPWARVGDEATATPTFQEEKKTTVTAVNPSTGVRTPVSITVDKPATQTNQEKPASDGPKECGSPGRAKCQIDETGMPEAETFDKEKDIKTIEEANTTRNTEFGKINEQTSGITKDWFPTIPTAACVNPKVPMPITSAFLEVPICPGVDAFRALFGIVVAFFVVMGSVHNIQQAIKA
jgi:hypothetical protein